MSKKLLKLNNRNYYSQDANLEYLSVSQYKDFCGSLGKRGCEAHALAKLKGEWQEEQTPAMLIGSYVDSYFEGSLEEFKENHPEIYLKNGNLKSDFIKAEEIIRRAEKDKYFMMYMSGQKQVITTAELFGVKWKIKMDSYIENNGIIDLKVVKDLHERFWVKDFGFTNFIEYWGYDFQLAIYQKVVEINTGKKLPCYIAGIDKGKHPDLAVIYISQNQLDAALMGIENNVRRIHAIKNGEIEPDRCEICDYCKETRILHHPIRTGDLIEL